MLVLMVTMFATFLHLVPSTVGMQITRTTSDSDKKHSIVAGDGVGPALVKAAKVAICLLGMAGTAVHGTDCTRPASTTAPSKPHSDETVPLIHASNQTHSKSQQPPMVPPPLMQMNRRRTEALNAIEHKAGGGGGRSFSGRGTKGGRGKGTSSGTTHRPVFVPHHKHNSTSRTDSEDKHKKKKCCCCCPC
ncbi:hypothetical protein niasHT_020087 [Heterodera trifolii]|uniref:Secreted protein n=1 Tax=Heterodera trifolii TaxID=157864 RepID=A0ABD2LJS1_9BILA